jgi:prepilin signal peptidase PulO-like enzyme (type II secretory pathway)
MNTIVSSIILAIISVLSMAMLQKQLNLSKGRLMLTFLGFVIIMGSLFYLIVKKFELNNYSLAYIITIYLLVIISITDINEKHIPVEIIMIGGITGGVMHFINPNTKGLKELIALVVFSILGLALYKISKEGIGLGDILVLIIITMFLGWEMALTILIFSLVLAGAIGFFLLVFKRVNKKARMPFVPFILVATLFVLFV